VILLSTSVYGAMRLEANSQLTSSVQISANIARKAPHTTLSVHVTGFKIRTIGYVDITVFGLLSKVPLVSKCHRLASGRSARTAGPSSSPSPTTPPPVTYVHCIEDPCSYLPSQCQMIFGAIFPPNASGNINETMNDGLVPGKYQDISVIAQICQSQKGCGPAAGGPPASHLDIRLSRLPTPEPGPKETHV
jgi:hypothetical protein